MGKIVVSEIWNIESKKRKKAYRCKRYAIHLGTLNICVSYISLGFKNGDIRVSITWGKAFN